MHGRVMAFAFGCALMSCGASGSEEQAPHGVEPEGGHGGVAGDAGGTGGDGGDSGGAISTGGDPEVAGAAGSDASGGTAGEACTGGASGRAGAPGLEEPCVGVTGGGREPFHDVRVTGRQFDALDGFRARLVVDSDDRFGIADRTIENGEFFLSIPETINDATYSGVGLYIDLNADDKCDEDEHMRFFVTGIQREDLVIEVTPAELCGALRPGQCRPWGPPAPEHGVCFINGVTDLNEPLRCPRRAALPHCHPELL